MGEGRLSGDESPSNRRLTVPEAAAALGITEAAVRGRVKRGTLRSYREEGAVFVVLIGGESPSKRDASTDEPSDQSQLIAVLREQLAAEREANRENRRIIAGLVQRIPELEAPRDTPRDAPHTTETAPETEEDASPRSDTVGAQEGVQEPEEVRRSWWRRIFGG